MSDQPSVCEGVAAYWAEVQRPTAGVSTSHITLGHLYKRFGRAAVDAELESYNARERDEQARRSAALHAELARGFYARYDIVKDDAEEL